MTSGLCIVGPHYYETEIDREEYQKLTMKYPRNWVTGEKAGKVYVRIISDTAPELENSIQPAVNLEDVYLYLYQ